MIGRHRGRIRGQDYLPLPLKTRRFGDHFPSLSSLKKRPIQLVGSGDESGGLAATAASESSAVQ